jgi:hypothetical protein
MTNEHADIVDESGNDKASHEISEDEIDDTLSGSFPASDPPSWTTGTDHHTSVPEDPDNTSRSRD